MSVRTYRKSHHRSALPSVPLAKHSNLPTYTPPASSRYKYSELPAHKKPYHSEKSVIMPRSYHISETPSHPQISFAPFRAAHLTSLRSVHMYIPVLSFFFSSLQSSYHHLFPLFYRFLSTSSIIFPYFILFSILRHSYLQVSLHHTCCKRFFKLV